MKKISKVDRFLIFCFSMIVIFTIIDVIIKFIRPDIDMNNIETLWFGVFGCVEVISCVVVKAFNIKNEN